MQQAIFIRFNGRYTRINFSEIIYIEAKRNYLKLHCLDKSYLILMSLKKMMELLPENIFYRIHKSYIISLEHLTSFNHEKAWLGQMELPIGDHFGRELSMKLNIANDECFEKNMDNQVFALSIQEITAINGKLAS